MMRNLIWALLLGVAAVAAALTPCDYSIPEYGGTPCNQLPDPPPVTQDATDCFYYFCDENDPCDSEPTIWTKKTRRRDIRKAGADPVQYYDNGVVAPDVDAGCCHCQD